MPTSEALSQLRAQIATYEADPYLLTVSANGTPHCGAVTLDWDADQALIRSPGTWPGSQAAGYLKVSVLFPAAAPGGYTLIIDGTAAARSDAGTLAISVTRAVLHRPARSPSQSETSCGSDCRPVLS
jgi:hypothetical protein